jgi:hypothetical protein
MFLTFHHALLKTDNKPREITIATELVFTVFESVLPGDHSKPCTNVIANGGATIPVMESREVVIEKLEGAKTHAR